MHGIHHLRCSGSRTLQLGRARAPYESFQVFWALQAALEHGFIRLQPQEVVERVGVQLQQHEQRPCEVQDTGRRTWMASSISRLRSRCTTNAACMCCDALTPADSASCMTPATLRSSALAMYIAHV